MNSINKSKNPIFINSLLALSLFLNATSFGVYAQETKTIDKASENVENSTKETEEVVESKEPEKKVETVESKSIKKLRESFIKFDVATAFGTIPSMTLAIGKQALEVSEPKKPASEDENEDQDKEESTTKDNPEKESSKKEEKASKTKKTSKQKSKTKSKTKKTSSKKTKSSQNKVEESVEPELPSPEELLKAKQEKFSKSKNQKLARCFVYLGYSFLLDSNAPAAKNCFLTATILNPKSHVAKCYLIHSLGRLCKFDEQESLLEELKKLEDKPAFVLFTLAKNELRLKRSDQALNLIETALKIPDDKNNCKNKLLILKAKAYAQLGLGDLTIKAYKDAAEQTENDYIEQILLANSKLIVGDLKGSKEFILNASKILPDDPIWQYKLGNFYAGENKGTKAIEYLLASTVTNRLSTKAYYSLANQYNFNGKFDNALSAVHHVQKLVPYSATAYATEGDIYKRSGNIKNAIESYDESLKADPTTARVYYELAYLYSISKRKDEAVDTFKKAIELMPNYWRIRFNFAEILWQQKMYNEAKDECLKGITLLSKPSDQLNILAQHYLSRAHAMLGFLSNKNKDTKRTIEEAVLFNQLKYLPILPEALRYVKLRPERLVFSDDLSEKDPMVQAAIGDMFYELKDYKTSEKHYREAIKLSPDDADLHSYLLNVLTHKNDWAGAAQENLIYSGKIVNRLPGKLGEWLSPKEKK